MTPSRPTIRQLEYLVALADALHFGRAARSVAISQPALSAQIKELEELLGVSLFERSRPRVLVTGPGKEVVARARRLLAEIDELVNTATRTARPLCGPLWMGVIPTVAAYLLPRVLPAVRRGYPDLQLFLREDQTSRLVDLIAAGKLDVLLLALPAEAPGCDSVVLFREPFVAALPKKHPLAAKRRLHQRDLEDEVVLLLEDGHCLRNDAMAVCRASGAREADQVRATSLGTLTQMVAGGLGVTLLPSLAVKVEARGVAVRPFVAPAPGRDIGLMWRKSSPRSDEFRLLGETIATEAHVLLAR